MTDIEILEATQQHIDDLRAHIRADDRLECWAAYGMDATEAIQTSFNISTLCWAAVRAGRCLAVFGVSPADGSWFSRTLGVPWLLGSEELSRLPLALMRVSRWCVPLMLERYDELVNYVMPGNTISLGWLKRLGATIESPAPYGVYGADFHRFTLRRPSCV